MQTTLFDIREFEGTPASLTPKHRWIEDNGYTCRQCKGTGKGGSAKVALYNTVVYGGVRELSIIY